MKKEKPQDRLNNIRKITAELLQKLPEESSTRKQIFNYLELFQDSAFYLEDKSHRLAFIGNIGTGKTTAICHILSLLDKNEPILSTGSGRTTLCEVEIIYDQRLKIEVIPHSKEEVISYLQDFSLYLLESHELSQETTSDGFKLSAEIERALRNMLNLRVTREKDNNKWITNDEAKNFSSNFRNTEDLANALLEKINLSSRIKNIFTNDGNTEQNTWLKNTFKMINNATDPKVGLAKKIIISIPQNIDTSDLSISILDTKGVDQTVNRQDLDNCFTDNRTISVLCCRFNDAPDKTMISLLRNAKEAGLSQRISSETILLILDRDQEAQDVINIDEPIGDKEEGREIRASQIANDIRHSLQIESLDIQFLDAKLDDATELYKLFKEKLIKMRNAHNERLNEIENAVLEIEKEITSKTIKQAKQQIKNTLEPWLKKTQSCTPSLKEYFLLLIRDIAKKGTHAASLRASVNRRGKWHNLDYYQNLSAGARQQIVEQVDGLKNELYILIENMLSQNNLQPGYALLKQMKHTTEKRLGALYQQVFSEGRSVYEEKLWNDLDFWNSLSQEWGKGSGYKDRISVNSLQWFQNQKYPNFESRVTSQAIDYWCRYTKEIQDLLGVDEEYG